MRYQGRITTWKDDKGFGFITPNSGGRQVFLHISSFSNRRRRPKENESVTYEIKADHQGRPKATTVTFVGESPRSSSSSTKNITRLLLVACFMVIVSVLVLTGRLPFAVLALYFLASLVTFFAYAIDKSAARKKGWRTSESTLHLFSVLGGWPGGLLAQRAFRHKSRKMSFQVEFWITVLLNCAALLWILTPSGSEMLQSILGSLSV